MCDCEKERSECTEDKCKKNKCKKDKCKKDKCKDRKKDKCKKEKRRIRELEEELEMMRDAMGNCIKCRPFHEILNVSGLTQNQLTAVQALTPNKLIVAYGFNLSTPKPLGAGAKIAIVVAYNYPTLQADLNTYLAHFGLPAKTVRIA